MEILNKNIFQDENMKSSFISIGNLIQSTKWYEFPETVTVPFTYFLSNWSKSWYKNKFVFEELSNKPDIH